MLGSDLGHRSEDEDDGSSRGSDDEYSGSGNEGGSRKENGESEDEDEGCNAVMNIKRGRGGLLSP